MNTAAEHVSPTDQRKCWELLAALQTLHIGVIMHAGDGTALGTGMVLAVDNERGVLLLDVPTQAIPTLDPDAPIRLEAQIEGRRLEFVCQIQRVVQLPDGPAFLARNPILKVDKQRRAAYRVHLPAAQLLQAAISNGEGKPLQVDVVDISTLGFGVRCPPASAVAEGVAVHCTISLPELDLTAEATVRHKISEPGNTRLGLEFKELTPALEQTLNRAVVKLERMILRSRSGLASRRRA